MKTYVIFCFVQDVGGGQNYVNTKVPWLKEKGWNVIVFGAVTIKSGAVDIPWNNLKEFEPYRKIEFNKFPEAWSKRRIEKTLIWMEKCIGNNNDEIVVESHTDFFADWGERFAQRVGAKHICYLLDERLWMYRAKEFLYYKYLRDEVAGIHISSMKKLFSGYHEVPESGRYVLDAAHAGDVADIESDVINRLEKLDYNIAYIGRNKQYVPNIVQGIKEFAENHVDKKIHFIVLGQVDCHLLNNVPNNLKVSCIGYLTPIPRSFFSHIDVAIAGSGCAGIATGENVLTIVADAKTCYSSGILGYTVHNALFSDNQPEKFSDALEDVLIYQTYKKHPYVPGNKIDIDAAFLKHFEFINSSFKTVKYFDFDKHPQVKYSYQEKIKCYGLFFLTKYAPSAIPRILALKNKIKSSFKKV